MSVARVLAAGGLALSLAGGPPVRAEEPWRPIEGSWSVSGHRLTLPVEGGAEAAIVDVSGAVLLSRGDGLSRGFQGQAVGFADGLALAVGRCVWTDENGDRIFSRLKGEPIGTGKRLLGTITGGTGRYAGLEGEFSLVWQYVVPGEDGLVQGRAVKLTGQVRQGSPRP